MHDNSIADETVSRRSSLNKKSIFDIEGSDEIGKVLLSEDSDSSSSSENFQKPFRPNNRQLVSDDEEDLKVAKGTRTQSDEELDGININDTKKIAGNESTSSEKKEFYDFTKILKSQEEITELAEKLSRNTGPSESKPTRRPKRKCKSKDNTESLDVKDLLLLGESKNKNSEVTSQDDELEQSESEEDIASEENIGEGEEKELKTIEVTIQEPNVFNKRRPVGNRFETELKRLLNHKRRKYQLVLHKVHLLCLIANGIYLNNIAKSEDLLAIALSIIPSKKYYPPQKTTKQYVEKLLDWFSSKMAIPATSKPSNRSILYSLILDFSSSTPQTQTNLILMFIVVARVLGMRCRLVVNLCPVAIRPPSDIPTDSDPKGKTKKNEPVNKTLAEDSDDGKIQDTKKKPTKKTETKKKKDAKVTFKDDSEEDIEKVTKKKPAKKTEAVDRKTKNKASRSSSRISNRLDDKKVEHVTNTINVSKKRVQKRKVISSDSEDEELVPRVLPKKSKKSTNMWCEVYLEAEGKWTSVDVLHNKVDCDQYLYENCTTPVSYVLACNDDGSVKDVTRRYVPQWHICLKTRVSLDWWEATLMPWKPKKSRINDEEDKQLEKKLDEMPFPKSISEFKNHPLYALKRHLLKFEAIFPPQAVPLGQIKGEDIYARVCVVELHTKESWMKEGKVLKPNQDPYKIVKARPKREKGTNNLIKDLPLNLYGYWQVDDYIPPTVADGKVPRNEFGNVELYKPWMVPKGAVHLQLPGMMRLARKLKIDCAYAVVGWEFRGQGSHPVLDGVVVCEEYKQQLLDAWNEEIDNSAKKTKESRKMRVLSNWRKLVRALLLRNKLKGKYQFKFDESDTTAKQKKKKK